MQLDYVATSPIRPHDDYDEAAKLEYLAQNYRPGKHPHEDARMSS